MDTSYLESWALQEGIDCSGAASAKAATTKDHLKSASLAGENASGI